MTERDPRGGLGGNVPDAAEFRILGLDVGHRRVGLALSDPVTGTASPLPPISGRQRSRVFDVLATRCAEHGVGAIVVGLPYTLRGEIGPQAQVTLKFVEALRQRTALPVETWDETYSTAEARDLLRERGVPPARWPEYLDSLAAAVMLQSYVDARRAPAPAPKAAAGDSEVSA